jgi:menaquinone-9 beta-reductase
MSKDIDSARRSGRFDPGHVRGVRVTFDVAVLGAGPAGVAAAIGLARLGWSVRLYAHTGPGLQRFEGGAERLREALDTLNLRRTLATVTERVTRTIQWGAREPHEAQEYLVERRRFDAALHEDAASNGVLLTHQRVDAVDRSGSLWRVRAGRTEIQARALVDTRGRRRRGPVCQIGPRLLAVTQRYFGVGLSAGTRVIAGTRAWYWLAADGRGRAQLQAVTAPEGSASQQGLRDRLFGNHALPADLRAFLARARPTGELRGCTATSHFVPPAQLEGKVIAGDASVAHDPLSGHGMYEALAATAAVVAGVNTWLALGEWSNVRRFLQERSAELWSRKLRVASALYEEAAATTHSPFWSQTARSYGELARSLPSTAPSVAEFQHRPVLNGSRIELRKVLVTPRWPRGIWRYRETELAAVCDSQKTAIGAQRVVG